VQSRAPYRTNDYPLEFPGTPGDLHGVTAAVAAPLIHQGSVLGALSVNSYDPAKQFTNDDAECLELLAGVASGVLASLERSAELALANTELRQARDEARHQALHDSLTGLCNRTLLADRLRHEIDRAERNDDHQLALLLMDLDRFKEINDTLGHHTGDRLLQEVARRLTDELRGSDTIARLGGDEFAVVVSDCDETSAPAIAARLIELLETPYAVDGHDVAIGASIGIAVYPVHGRDSDTLMRRADAAMYAAKRNHSGYRLATLDDEQPASERLMLASSLRNAIDRDELTLYFQPIVECGTRRVAAMEALVRWNHPTHGLIAPDRFIPLAEQTGLIGSLTRWVLRTALRQVRDWESQGFDAHVAVNLSAHDLQDASLPDRIASLLAEWQVSPGKVTLELTETAIMTDRERGFGNAQHGQFDGGAHSDRRFRHWLQLIELPDDAARARVEDRPQFHPWPIRFVTPLDYQSCLVASAAPLTMFSYFAQAAWACQRMPQSVPAMTFSRPQTLAKVTIVSAITSGGSTTGVV
jgi:diguanylate cyclase (GGDEF)-like protein